MCSDLEDDLADPLVGPADVDDLTVEGGGTLRHPAVILGVDLEERMNTGCKHDKRQFGNIVMNNIFNNIILSTI